jgi:uncharacterized protein YjlB
MKIQPEKYYLNDDGIFPNSALPVLFYKQAIKIPNLFPAIYLKSIFRRNNWRNAWDNGVFNYQHYHSITHEVMGVYAGGTIIELGGTFGITLYIEKGDVLVIPAGVAHRNLEFIKKFRVVGAYPDGRDFDMNYGKPGERPGTDEKIATVPVPLTDPLMGSKQGLPLLWPGK